MWSCEISIDKKFNKEYDFMADRIKRIKNLSFAEEESADRKYIYVASLCEFRESVQEAIENAIVDIFLIFLKLDFFLSRFMKKKLSHSVVALLCSLVCFDRQFEEAIVRKSLSEVVDYNLDGILNFRLRDLTANWDELAELADNLLKVATTSDDIFNVATFLTSADGGESEILVDESGGDCSVYNLTLEKCVPLKDLFDEKEFNILFSVVKENPKKIILQNVVLTKEMLSTLEKLSNVEMV